MTQFTTLRLEDARMLISRTHLLGAQQIAEVRKHLRGVNGRPDMDLRILTASK